MLKRLAVTAAAIAVIGLWQPAFANNNKDLTLVPTHGELADKTAISRRFACELMVRDSVGLGPA